MSDVLDVMSRLGNLERLMRKHRVNAWADEIRQVQLIGADRQPELKRRVFDLYAGSMGSITDLIISRVNGHDVEDEAAANTELDRMVHDLWVRAREL